ncbi:MAG: RagB/SusD family nutrient uptake outer membrane protein [Bacteroidales bacterium]|nr:RagB/SusD family nutrient uptake outer membrane protein [Bacteroidales bacterium]
MKHMYRLSIIMLASLLAASCADSWKDKVNTDWEEKYVWNISEMSSGVLYRAYNEIPTFPDTYGNNFLDVATDNAATNQYGSSAYFLSQGGMSATNNPLAVWAAGFRNIQYINSFLENGLGAGVRYNKVDAAVDAAYKKQFYGEAMFLRAYWQFRMLQVYGGKSTDGTALGYPILTKFITQEEASDFSKIKRDSYEDCVAQIFADCDSAAANLPAAYVGENVVIGSSVIGKPTSVAAACLKAITALYAASPAYQDDSVVKLNAMGDYTVVDAAAYNAKWVTAATLANAAINMAGFGGTDFYSLKNTDLADAPTATPAEFIFRFYANNRAMESRHFPPYYYGKANTVPSQNLVDAYPAGNGYPITDIRSGYDPNHPYDSRDMRLYRTVYYDGSVFGNSGKPMNMMPGGKDSFSYNENASQTSYYLAKFLSVKSAMLTPAQMSNSIHYIPIIRRAYIFLAFAEASNEAWGPTVKGPGCAFSAYDIIKSVREKSGGITDTGYLDEVAAAGTDAFAALIQNERRLEFAFENQRYFDMRRRLQPLNEDVRGMKMEISDSGAIVYDPTFVVSRRPMNELRYYYAPIPYDECAKNPNMVNNMGWK